MTRLALIPYVLMALGLAITVGQAPAKIAHAVSVAPEVVQR